MKIIITYINHSGFLLEWDSCYFLFDYYNGQIPSLDSNKMLVVFVSHGHGDHFNPEIFRLYKEHPKTTYLISSDIKLNKITNQKYGITEEISSLIKVVKPNQKYEIFDKDNNRINIETLKSTDSGVAFLIGYKDKTIYHAGDLNLWMWMGETKQYNNNMSASFKKEISKLENKNIDIAFAPLDPRQEEWYNLGMDALLKSSKVKYVFPMHFWDKPEIIQKYINESDVYKTSTNIMDIKQEGQKWSIEL
ncbi:MAG: MBL fold metallo-hydrolase [Clostridiales bacterium]|jgi:L-ascorbate metabolism protein UlaG (beta-lactamase superfamily)|nr:MBL fold metallo-hydrolase [Clostridiales bacterium]